MDGGTAATNNGASKPSHVSFTVGLPDLLSLNIQSRQPTSSVAVGVDDLDVSQVEDLAVLLRGMTGDHRLPRVVRPGVISRNDSHRSIMGCSSIGMIGEVVGVDEDVGVGLVIIEAAFEELEVRHPG